MRQIRPRLTPSAIPKDWQVYQDIHSAIRTGSFQPGERLPSEAELGERYDTLPITVAKVLNKLQLQKI
jgi:DNA-binding GntR family transcriptional regulator